MAKKILIANQKGGVGKTTTCMELSKCLAEKSKRVLLIDMDQQCDLSLYIKADMNKPSIYDVLASNNPISDAICHLEAIDFIQSSPKLQGADKEFGGPEDVFKLDTELSVPLIEEYDYVIIDTNPSRNTILKMCYCCADYVIFPSDCDDGSIKGIIDLYNDIGVFKNIKIPFSHTEVLGIILCKYKNTRMHAVTLESLNKLMESMNKDGFVLTVRSAIVTSEARFLNESLQKYKHWSNPAVDYRIIADKVIELTEGE